MCLFLKANAIELNNHYAIIQIKLFDLDNFNRMDDSSLEMLSFCFESCAIRKMR